MQKQYITFVPAVKPVPHSASLSDSRFVYVPSDKTDITQTWRRAGWVPPSEQKKPKL
jgi:hypothetical protein